MTTVAPPKGAKLTDDQLAAQARTRIATLHANPRFDLQSEAWIPVLRDGGVEHVGLRTVFQDAHLITDLAMPQPLLRAAMRRFLTALTADLVRRDTGLDSEAWESAHESNQGFTSGQIDTLLTGHSDHLWLWHPTSPFLQDHRLARAATKPHGDLPIQDLLLHLPSGSTMAWWVKAGEPALEGGLEPAEVARWLVARWFYAVNGNAGDVRLPDGSTVGAQAGGAFAETVATVTHAFRADGVSLFRTLLRGMPAGLTRPGPATEPALAGCAWLDPQQPRPAGSALYLATLNPACVLLTGCDDAGNVTRWLRGSVPITGEIAKALRNAANAADGHRIKLVLANGKSTPVKIEPGALRAEAVQQFHREAMGAQQLTGVVASTGCLVQPGPESIGIERLDLFLVSKGGTGSSPVWEDMAGLELPARYVDPDGPQIADIRAAVAIAFDPKDGVKQRIERAIGDLLAQPTPEGWQRPKRTNSAYLSLRDKAVGLWFAEAAAAFEDALDHPTGLALERWRQVAFVTARDAFDQVALPYSTSSRYAPRYAAALRHFQPKGL